MPPTQVIDWIRRTYPRPQVDSEWLDSCYNWVVADCQLNPATELHAIIDQVNQQLLQSNLQDSMIPGTGMDPQLPSHEITKTVLVGQPILVEVICMTEVGHSAFSLGNIRQARMERADLAGLASDENEQGNEQGEEDGPIPKYPRSMLRFQLSDGSTVLDAIEYKRLNDLVLGESPLGFKMILKPGLIIRRGIAFLEPSKVILKGYQTEDRQDNWDVEFVQGLNFRMGKEVIALPPQPEAEQETQTREPEYPPTSPAPAPMRDIQPPSLSAVPVAHTSNYPAEPIPPSPQPDPATSNVTPDVAIMDLDDEIEELPRRTAPTRPRPSGMRGSSPIQALGTTKATEQDPTRSVHFSEGGRGKGKERVDLRLSPHRRAPLFLPESDNEVLDDGIIFKGIIRSPQKHTANSKRGGKKVQPNGDDSDYDYDNHFTVNSEQLASLEQLEKEANAQIVVWEEGAPAVVISSSSGSGSGSGGTTRSRGARSGTNLARSPNGSLSSSAGAAPPPPPPNQRRAQRRPPTATQVDLGTVSVSSSSEGEKENAPVPPSNRSARQQRAAFSSPARPLARERRTIIDVPDEDVIEISD